MKSCDFWIVWFELYFHRMERKKARFLNICFHETSDNFLLTN